MANADADSFNVLEGNMNTVLQSEQLYGRNPGRVQVAAGRDAQT
jgi:hypothetical protein